MNQSKIPISSTCIVRKLGLKTNLSIELLKLFNKNTDMLIQQLNSESKRTLVLQITK